MFNSFYTTLIQIATIALPLEWLQLPIDFQSLLGRGFGLARVISVASGAFRFSPRGARWWYLDLWSTKRE